MPEREHNGWSRQVWREVADQAAAAIEEGLFEHQLLGLVLDPNNSEKALVLARQFHPECSWEKVNGTPLPQLAGICPEDLRERLLEINPHLREMMNQAVQRGMFLVLAAGGRHIGHFLLNLPQGQRKDGGQW